MRWRFVFSAVILWLLALSCDDKECCQDQEKAGAGTLTGEWLLYERGYSPGAGYIIDPVSAVPPQVIEFKSNGELSCTVEGLTDYKIYFVDDDVVALFKADPGPKPDTTTLTHSYNFSFEEGNLKLGFRYCYEGCHLGFRKIE